MSPQETRPTISDVRLERYRLGELPPDEHEHVTARLAGDPALRYRLSQMERSDQKIAEAYPARDMAAEVRRRAAAAPSSTRQPDPRHRRGWLAPVSLVATGVCVLAVATTVWFRLPVADDTTIKGGGDIALVLHRRVADGSEALPRAATAREGDQIRLGYRASGHRYGAILSIDGRGTLTQHLPATGEQSALLQPSGTTLLDAAYELDDAPRWETFYFVAGDAPFELEPVRRAIRQAAAGRSGAPGSLDLPRAFAQFVFPLTKVHP